MFTGLIREIAEVADFSGNTLSIKAKYKPKIGDSVCVNGACLTVTEISAGGFKVELSHESRKILAVENLKGFVHIEPAMTLGSRIDGHLLQGHVDAVGEIVKIEKDENGVDFFIKSPKEIMKFLSSKGSVAIDGVSLTVGEITENVFKLTIIPHTFSKTVLNSYKVGRRVNIETDMIARYLYNLTTKKEIDEWAKIDRIMALY
ncbi:MAG: riboflavin synthase [Campylobacteraceae bacterium]|jgi:riboflavin synthase|nr:riboflavin synthase [Campylobacteraceae bacterium]